MGLKDRPDTRSTPNARLTSPSSASIPDPSMTVKRRPVPAKPRPRVFMKSRLKVFNSTQTEFSIGTVIRRHSLYNYLLRFEDDTKREVNLENLESWEFVNDGADKERLENRVQPQINGTNHHHADHPQNLPPIPVAARSTPGSKRSKIAEPNQHPADNPPNPPPIQPHKQSIPVMPDSKAAPPSYQPAHNPSNPPPDQGDTHSIPVLSGSKAATPGNQQIGDPPSPSDNEEDEPSTPMMLDWSIQKEDTVEKSSQRQGALLLEYIVTPPEESLPEHNAGIQQEAPVETSCQGQGASLMDYIVTPPGEDLPEHNLMRSPKRTITKLPPRMITSKCNDILISIPHLRTLPPKKEQLSAIRAEKKLTKSSVSVPHCEGITIGDMSSPSPSREERLRADKTRERQFLEVKGSEEPINSSANSQRRRNLPRDIILRPLTTEERLGNVKCGKTDMACPTWNKDNNVAQASNSAGSPDYIATRDILSTAASNLGSTDSPENPPNGDSQPSAPPADQGVGEMEHRAVQLTPQIVKKSKTSAPFSLSMERLDAVCTPKKDAPRAQSSARSADVEADTSRDISLPGSVGKAPLTEVQDREKRLREAERAIKPHISFLISKEGPTNLPPSNTNGEVSNASTDAVTPERPKVDSASAVPTEDESSRTDKPGKEAALSPDIRKVFNQIPLPLAPSKEGKLVQATVSTTDSDKVASGMISPSPSPCPAAEEPQSLSANSRKEPTMKVNDDKKSSNPPSCNRMKQQLLRPLCITIEDGKAGKASTSSTAEPEISARDIVLAVPTGDDRLSGVDPLEETSPKDATGTKSNKLAINPVIKKERLATLRQRDRHGRVAKSSVSRAVKTKRSALRILKDILQERMETIANDTTERIVFQVSDRQDVVSLWRILDLEILRKKYKEEHMDVMNKCINRKMPKVEKIAKLYRTPGDGGDVIRDLVFLMDHELTDVSQQLNKIRKKQVDKAVERKRMETKETLEPSSIRHYLDEAGSTADFWQQVQLEV